MNQGKPIKVHVTGGDNWQERELVTDTIATAMRDRGFNGVAALNSAGNESDLKGVMPRTVFEAVKVVSPLLINRDITIDPGYDGTHPEAFGDRTGSWHDLPGTEMSVYDPNYRPEVGSRWATKRSSQDNHRIPGIHTAVRTEGTQYGAILDTRNSDRPGPMVEAVEKEFNERVTHVGIIADSVKAATEAVTQVLQVATHAHVTVSLVNGGSGVLPPLMDTKNSQFFNDREETRDVSLPNKIDAIQNEMRRYGDPETFAITPQNDGLYSATMGPRTKGEADKLYSAIMSGPQGAHRGLVDYDTEEGYLTTDDFGNPLNDDPNHEKIRDKVVESILHDASNKALKRADQHLAGARASLEKAKEIDFPAHRQLTEMVRSGCIVGTKEGLTRMAEDALKAESAEDFLGTVSIAPIPSLGELTPLDYNPPIENDNIASSVAIVDGVKQSRKRNKK